MKLLSTILMAAAAASSFGASHSGLASPRFASDLAAAEKALVAGDAEQAEAYALAVRRPVIRYELAPSATQLQVEAVRRAAAIWEKALEGRVEFIEVPATTGDVRITFSERVTFMGKDVAGKAVWSRAIQKLGFSGWISTLSATLHIRTEVDGSVRPLEELARTVAHEMGHLMGLADSRNPRAVMGPDMPGLTPIAPTADEAAALMDLHAHAEELLLLARLHLGTMSQEG
jgi:hypothetical protein